MAPSAATSELERTSAMWSRGCRLVAATSTLAWSVIDAAMGKVLGNSLGLNVTASLGVAGGGRPERADVVAVGRILQSQKGSHQKRDLFLVHEVQQGLIVDGGIGAIILVEQFQTPMAARTPPAALTRLTPSSMPSKLARPATLSEPLRRKGGPHLDDGRGVAAPFDGV